MDSNPRKIDSIPLKIFQVQVRKEVKLDSNLLYSDSNPRIWKCKEHMKDSNPRKMDLNPIYRLKLKAGDQVEGFESLSYGFVSPFGA